ncbi:sulfite exporter TauE/SafE family protein [Alteromonas sp. a30]|uniref:sulfite exporter TauE/SafE family protein n=1 Tax=Alteromonas sp. a30 TaxID=2730917 RepID=UPI00227FABFF|nr:sulfite exporter TauE/SafE family protein [Alteromonas sp. a30]MCY7293881.1 sulfite exporter TauE/SafE family protein [Alteromonas sp. a30]
MINDLVPIVLALVAAGTFAGILAGLLGVGGGIIIVPVLFFIFQHMGVSPDSAMVIATATSLATIVPTSLSSIRSHHQRGNVDFNLFWRWAPAVTLGVLLGSWMITTISGIWFTLLFGILAVYSSLSMLFKRKQSVIREGLPSAGIQRIIATFVGFLASMVGIGGGTISIPVLTACNYSAQRAVGTAAAIGLSVALPGAITLLFLGNTPPDAPQGTYGLVNFLAIACIVPLTVFFAPQGAKLASRLNSDMLKRIFAILLFITGLRMLSQLFL